MLPAGGMRAGQLIDWFGDDGLLLLSMMLVIVFLIPVSIPGVSTVFGAIIVLVGVSRLLQRPLWLPEKLRLHEVPTDRLKTTLGAGLIWVQRLEKISTPHRLGALVDSKYAAIISDSAFILAALLLMAPFGLVPFSNTLPAVAVLFFAIGLLQRDGIAVLLGHLLNIATISYFSVLIAGSGLAIKEFLQRVFAA
jgi:hypothetical protein